MVKDLDMESIQCALNNRVQDTNYFPIFGEYYNHHSLYRLISKAKDLGLVIPECLNELLSIEHQPIKSSQIGSYCEVHALELPETLDSSVKDYIMNVLFKDQSQIDFTPSMMAENGLESVMITEDHFEGRKPNFFTHFIEYKGLRFYYNAAILMDEGSYLIISLIDAPKRNNSISISFPVHSPKTLKLANNILTKEKNYNDLISVVQQSEEVENLIQAIRDNFCSKKRLIIGQEAFSYSYNLTSGRRGSVAELFIQEHEGYDIQALPKFASIAHHYLPNSDIRFLSSEYGIVELNQVITAYAHSASSNNLVKGGARIKTLAAQELRAWSKKVETQLVSLQQEQQYDGIYLLTYSNYAKRLQNLHENTELPSIKNPFDIVNYHGIGREIGRLFSFVDFVDLIEPYYFSTV